MCKNRCSLLQKCLKQQQEAKNMKPSWKVTSFEQQICCPQHRTAQLMTARRNVIHTSFSPSFFSLLSYPSILCFMPENYHHYSRKILPGNHHGRFTRIRWSFAGTRLCIAGILGENKKLRLVIILASNVTVDGNKQPEPVHYFAPTFSSKPVTIIPMGLSPSFCWFVRSFSALVKLSHSLCLDPSRKRFIAPSSISAIAS